MDVLQPIILRKKGSKYEIVVGERSYRASNIANLNVIPAVVNEFTDRTDDGTCYFREPST